ncbi:MAG: PfkB family carbohydrate kinase [Christensenellaceae bacterium]|jgi:pseudouridine kinase|nr:PfkB family carbohydrate kinase [Christensenellaceae bacterium]
MQVCVIGGLNMDITGTPFGQLCLRDSNMGAVRVTPGGVGRNIAENLARMGFAVELIAPLGQDGYADMHRTYCAAAGIGLTHAPVLPQASGTYFCLMDGQGDMYAAINDMSICDALTPDMIDMQAANAADAIVLDTNLPQAVISHVVRAAKPPLFADPVSAAKARKLVPALHKLHGLKPNVLEAQALTGQSGPEAAALALRALGVRRVFVSVGAQGMFVCDYGARDVMHLPATAHGAICNATGAGDSAAAAIVAGSLLGFDALQTARLACEVSALTLASEGAVSPLLSPAILAQP